MHSFVMYSSIPWNMTTHRTTRPWSTNPYGCLRHISAESQSSLNEWLGRSVVFSLGFYWPKSTNDEILSMNVNNLSILHHTDINDQADRRIILRCPHNNVIISQNFVLALISAWRTVTVHDNPFLWKRSTKWREVWLRVFSLGHPRRELTVLAAAAAAPIYRVHQLNPMTFELDDSDLLTVTSQLRVCDISWLQVLLSIKCTSWMSYVFRWFDYWVLSSRCPQDCSRSWHDGHSSYSSWLHLAKRRCVTSMCSTFRSHIDGGCVLKLQLR